MTVLNRSHLKSAYILVLLVLCMAGRAAAQQVQIGVNATEITTDQALVMSVTLSGVSAGQIPQPQFPEIKGMQAAGTSSSQNWVNGKASVSFSRNYITQTPGTYKVPAMSYTFKGATTQSQPITVKVTKGTGKPQGGYRDPFADFFNDPFFGGQQQPQQNLKYKSLDADYFLTVNLDKESCYIGEQVHGDVKLYVNERDARKIKVDGMAIFEMQQRVKNTGFWQEIIELKEIPAERAQANGKNYIAYTLFKNILFPIKTGDIAFKDIYLDGMKLAVATNASPIARFMGQDTKFEKIKIKAADRRLIVKPLPVTKLTDASMVGKFKLEAALNHQEIKTGENLELEVKIAGNGNMAMMADPVIAFPDGFEVYDPSTQFNSRVQGNGLIGDKTWKWSMLPARAGDYDLGPIKFFFFDPSKRAYDSLIVPEIKVKVTGEDIENQRISESTTDDFYTTALGSSAQKLASSHRGSGWILFGGLALVAGVVAARTMRRRKQIAKGGHVEAPTDFWSK
jgi:hypothetical protein